MKKMLLTCLVLLVACNMSAQTNVDSLLKVLESQKLTAVEKLKLYSDISDQYIERDNEKCIKYAGEGLKLAEKEKDTEKASFFSNHLGIAYYSKSSYDTSLAYLQKALNLAIEINDKKQECVVNSSMGNLYRRQSNYNEALNYYTKTLTISQNIGDEYYHAIALIGIGCIYRIMANYEKSIKYLEQAAEISKELNLPYLEMNINYNLGMAYNFIRDWEKVLECAKKTNELSLITGEKKFEIGSFYLIVAAYNQMGDTENAHASAQKSVQLAEEYGDKRLLMGTINGLADLYFYHKNYKECAALSLKAWNIDSTDLLSAKNTLDILVSSYIQLGDKERAYYFFSKYKKIIEEQSTQQYNNALAEMEVKFETEKKEIRIGKLEKERILYTWIIFVSIIAMLLLLGLFYFRQRLNKQQIKQLEQGQQLVATQALLDGETAERSRLARDLHDGLGGMLSVVKLNLKEMKHFGIMEEADVERFGKALGMLDQSIGELRRVAHHIMPESLLRYGLKIALEDFCHAIPGAHFQYFGEDPRLDSRVEILIYRCAYELVNNALKHAQATAINVQLMIDNGVVSLTVHDNGIGFNPQTVHAGIGLENIRTRIAIYNGKMNIHSLPETGTEICIEIEE
jgi:signal transduction histidine kinase